MTTTQHIAALARTAGAAGRDWSDWTCDDAVQAFVATHDGPDSDLDAWRAAFEAGHAEHVAAQGWVSRWTTAPDDYDTFGTTTAELCGSWRGRPLRRVLCHPHHADYQAGRYGSGLHASWSEDPRIEERAAAERRERWRAEDTARAALRADALVWLSSASDDELDAAVEADTIESRGLTYADVKDERKRRATKRAEAERRTAWDAAMAIVQPAIGAILVDDGEPARRDRYGVIPGRDAHVYYTIRVEAHGAAAGDAEQAAVLGAGNETVGSLACVASWITSGRVRIVAAADVPPEPVVRRIGHERWREIVRAEVAGRAVWVGRPRFASAPLVLTAAGRVARGKATAAAIARYAELGGW